MASLDNPRPFIEALSLLSQEDLQKVECVPFVSYASGHDVSALVEKLGTCDNQLVAMLLSMPLKISSPDLFELMIKETAKFYLNQEPARHLLQSFISAHSSKYEYACRVARCLEWAVAEGVKELKPLVSKAGIPEHSCDGVKGKMLRAKFKVLLGTTENEKEGILLRLCWKSHLGISEPQDLETALKLIKDLVGKDVHLCASVGAYLLRSKSTQTFKAYLSSIAKEAKAPKLIKLGIQVRPLFPDDVSLDQVIP